jgi:hypothetical protein
MKVPKAASREADCAAAAMSPMLRSTDREGGISFQVPQPHELPQRSTPCSKLGTPPTGAKRRPAPIRAGGNGRTHRSGSRAWSGCACPMALRPAGFSPSCWPAMRAASRAAHPRAATSRFGAGSGVMVRVVDPRRRVRDPRSESRWGVEVGYPDDHGTGGGTGPHGPRRAVAEAGGGSSSSRRVSDHDHATDSGLHADPPGPICDELRVHAPAAIISESIGIPSHSSLPPFATWRYTYLMTTTSDG